MVFFALTRQSFDDFVALGTLDKPLWLSAGVLSSDEMAAARARGLDISAFNQVVDTADVEDSLSTTREHDPGNTVWISR